MGGPRKRGRRNRGRDREDRVSISNCRDCGKEVMFVKHKGTGTKAPMDLKLRDNANCRIENNRYRILQGDELAQARQLGFQLFLNHLSICGKEDDEPLEIRDASVALNRPDDSLHYQSCKDFSCTGCAPRS